MTAEPMEDGGYEVAAFLPADGPDLPTDPCTGPTADPSPETVPRPCPDRGRQSHDDQKRRAA
ncbi:hypothetical protein STENM327S_05720 [Streptomyces tendae]